MIEKLNTQDRHHIVEFVLRYTSGEVAYQKALEVVQVLKKHSIDLEKSEFIPDPPSHKDFCIQLILTLAKHIPDGQMKQLMNEYKEYAENAPEPNIDENNPTKPTEQEVMPIEIPYTNRCFLGEALAKTNAKQAALTKTVYSDAYKFLKQIERKCNSPEGDTMLLSYRQCSVLHGYLGGAIEQTDHRRYKQILEVIEVAIKKYELENNINPN